ncbi:MAG TPA: hypothetical protein DCM28_14570 [Phycisphaerales bacterium]|nr:hypothetical protein [Phycisphaerales bacterium]
MLGRTKDYRPIAGSVNMSAFITEPQRQIPIDSNFDVAVIGGGIAGVAAALAAARQGVNVVLIEKQFGLGGLATLGNVIMYLPICDGNGKQVMGGICEELLHLSVAEIKEPLPKARFTPTPDCWLTDKENEELTAVRSRKRFMTSFNPYAFQLAMEEVITDAGITIMYDTVVCQTIRQGDTLTHLIVENKGGRLAIEAKQFIDCSGDADVCAFSNCKTENSPNNVLAGWHYEIYNGELRNVPWSNTYDKEHFQGNKAVGPFFNGIDHRDVTKQTLESRKIIREKFEEKRQKNPEDSIYPFGLTSIPDFRVTRRLLNNFSLGEHHMHTWLEDCVGLTGDWRRRGPVYPIPLRSLQSEEVGNLFVAGRCISADHSVVDVTRAIPTCAVSGEACGVAAALLVKDKIVDHTVPLEKLKKILIDTGGLLDRRLLENGSTVTS